MATMIANALIITIGSGLMFYLSRENKRAERGEKIIEGLEGFKYTL